MTRTLVALALCVSLLGGCSFAFSRSPRRSPITNEPPPCGPLYVAPVIDATQAAGGLLLTMAMLSEGSNHPSEMDTMGLLAGIMLAETGVYLASAIYGAGHVKACKRMHLEQQPLWITPRIQAPAPMAGPGPLPPPATDWPPEVEQTVDADENQIDVHTTIRRVPQPQ
jgi:hypothetical protein